MDRVLNDEKALIGASILYGDKHLMIDLSPADFLSDFYGSVWKKMQTMNVIDHTHLETEFFDNRADLADCVSATFSATNMGKIALRIKNAAHQRRVLSMLEKAHGLIKSGSGMTDVSGMVMKAFDDVHEGCGWKPLSDGLLEAYTDLERAQVEGVNCNFILSGYDDFDDMFGGLQKDGLIIISGRPGSGKSALAASIARQASRTEPCLIVSMEMTLKQLSMRYYALESEVNMQTMMQGKLTATDWSKMHNAQSRLMDAGIFINDTYNRTIHEVIAEARRFKRVKGIGMLVIDYLTLMDMGDVKKLDAITEATRALKNLAKELDCPILLLAQMNRKVEDRAKKEPQMSDLRDSGSIEQDADQIIFPFRPEMFDSKQPKHRAILHMAKNRNGQTGKIEMKWLGRSAKFVHKDHEDERHENY